jgi:hypothetical protein
MNIAKNIAEKREDTWQQQLSTVVWLCMYICVYVYAYVYVYVYVYIYG